MRPLLALLILAATLAVGACSNDRQQHVARSRIDPARRDQSGHLEPGHQPETSPEASPSA